MSQVHFDLPPDVPEAEAKLLLAVKLYEVHRLSLGQAAKFAGCSKKAFMESLGKLGVPVFNYPADDLARECESHAR